MKKKSAARIENVKPVSFEQFHISEDGEKIVFTVHGKGGGVGHIAIDWLKLGITAQLIGQAAEKAADVRRSLGKSDDFDGSDDLTFQLISGFQVSEIPDQKMKILSLQTPAGFHWDFAVPTNTPDQRGRSLPRAIAEELLADTTTEQLRPN